MITLAQVEDAQNAWGEGVVRIGSLKDDRPKLEQFASAFLDNLYAFELGEVLFKPTLASVVQFRPTKTAALSYFISGNADFPEDHGFAIKPWTAVRFQNANLILEVNRAIAMGNYFFTDLDGGETKVEYTFGYRLLDGQLKIDLHHSSRPYTPDAPTLA